MRVMHGRDIVVVAASFAPFVPHDGLRAVYDRTIGYQAKVGTTRGVVTVPQDGSIVSWSITPPNTIGRVADGGDLELHEERPPLPNVITYVITS